MRRSLGVLLAVLALSACGAGPEVAYRPAPQILPSNIQKISVRLVENKTQQFGLEDKFTLRIRDEFLRDGRFPITPEAAADGVIVTTIQRYILTPIQYDAHLVPTAYKLRMIVDLTFIDRQKNTAIWEERNLEGIQQYPAQTLPGGLTEEQAREAIYDTLARDVVKRTIEGFGAVTGTSQRRISSDGPSTVPSALPDKNIPSSINPNTY